MLYGAGIMAKKRKISNIGFVSTRFQGTDGVSLETEKWVHVLEKLGYQCYFFAGKSDWDPKRTMLEAEAYFEHPVIKRIQEGCFGHFKRSSELTGQIHKYRKRLKTRIYKFIDRFSIDLLIVENALSIPMNIPLGLALTEFIAETGFYTIGHHHDFHWERERFLINCINDYILASFPPPLPSIRHVVINSQADNELSYRRGLSPYIIPNVLNYKKSAPTIDEYSRNVRRDLGLNDDDIMFLQPTRIVARKGIEHAIEIVHRLQNQKIKLVICHQSGDEGTAYLTRIKSYAKMLNVPLIIKPEIIGNTRGITKNGKKIYTLWDIYPHADFVTFPSTYEGFGNALLEAIYFKKPILVNRYTIYQRDIEPLGFDVVEMNNYIDDTTIRQIQRLLNDPEAKKNMVEKNHKIASQFFSFKVLEHMLKTMLIYFEGIEEQKSLLQEKTDKKNTMQR
jgi:glycosyltransferase involved in cell wall biosynthesis